MGSNCVSGGLLASACGKPLTSFVAQFVHAA